ncbi:MAG: hypothetical protein ACREQX_06015, partial [Candidatus Binataceae bacterium]
RGKRAPTADGSLREPTCSMVEPERRMFQAAGISQRKPISQFCLPDYRKSAIMAAEGNIALRIYYADAFLHQSIPKKDKLLFLGTIAAK